MAATEVTVTIRAGAAECFEFVDNHLNTPRFMVGIRSYEPLTRKARGKGARFLSVLSVAGQRVESEVECTTWVRNKKLIGTARTGPKTRGGWTFVQHEDGSTDVTLRNEYELSLVFRLIPGVDALVERGMVRSLQNLKRLVEQQSRKRRPTRK